MLRQSKGCAVLPLAESAGELPAALKTAVTPWDTIDWEQEQAAPLRFSHSLRGLLEVAGQLGDQAPAVRTQPAQSRGRVELVGSHGRWKRPCLQNSSHDHMILRVDLVGSHGRWKRPCLQTAHMTI